MTTRKYIVRVTRHPLSDEEIAMKYMAGTLPDDHATRSVVTTDFVECHAATDAEAVRCAREKTRLKDGGERFTFDEANGPEFRPIFP